MNLSPVEKVDGIYLKREDLVTFNNTNGGKARVIDYLIKEGIEEGYSDFVSCGSRTSVQCEIISAACEYYKVNCYLFVPSGHDTPSTKFMQSHSHTTLIRTDAGYLSVIKKQSREYADAKEYFYIPFALEDEIAIDINKDQVQNIPDDVNRIIVPIGSGMNFISIIKGLEYYNKNIKVIGIQTGLDPSKNIEKFLDQTPIKYEIIKSELPYDKKANNYTIGQVELNRVYEAKCLPYLTSNDLLWIVGKDINNYNELEVPKIIPKKGDNKYMDSPSEMKFNDLTRDFIEDFISKLPTEDKKKLKEYIEANPRDNSSKLFMVVKSYIYNTYFKKQAIPEKRRELFSDSLKMLLSEDE